MENVCEFCNKKFSTKGSLKTHQKTAKYCFEFQDSKKDRIIYKCNNCNKEFSLKPNFERHEKSCFNKYDIKKENMEIKEQLSIAKKDIQFKDEQIKKLEEKVNKLEDTIASIAKQPRTTKNETTNNIIEIEEYNSEDEEEQEIEEDKPYELKPLEVGNGYTIEHREEDGYINITNLCKAGGKKFNDWFRLDKTKAFLRVLSLSTGIPANELIKYISGSNDERSTWAHPQVAINNAQWISPHFDVKVSAWVYEIMITGKVDITATKSYRQLQEENKENKLKIQMLTKKYVKAQPRQQITEQNVIYILTTPSLKKERRYILGKAKDMVSRLSTYNKTDEHEVVYYQACKDEESMSLVEKMVFKRLDDCREQANRERFILPENMEIDYFKNIISECIKFIF